VAAVFPAVAVLARGVSNVMLPKSLMYGAMFACGFLVLAGLHHAGNRCPAARFLALACASASADEKGAKDKPALSGVWLQDGEEMQIEFVGKDIVKFLPHGGNDCIIVCQYTVGKKGLVKAKITELEGNSKKELEKILPVGLEFSFRWTVKDDTGTLEEVKGEVEKSHLEGKYHQKK
jgi:hypothetical protein